VNNFGNFRVWATVLIVLFISSCDSGDSGGGLQQNDPPGNSPPATLTASRALINEGESTRLRWSSPTAESVDIQPGIGSVEPEGELVVTPEATTEYVLTARLGDDVSETTFTVTVRPLAAVSIIANVVEGSAPLAVRFSAQVDSLTAINRLYWDFEGDGGPIDGGLGEGAEGFDSIRGTEGFDVTGRDQTFVFESPGTYNTRIRVWDVAGNQADATLRIVVANVPPKAVIRVSPTTATAPLNARFTVDASDNEGIASYEWDFDGNGVYDETTTRGSTTFLYETPGEYEPVIRVTDSLGVSAQFSPLHLQVNARLEDVPDVTVSTRPTVGAAPLDVALSARVTTPGRLPVVSWAWDFDGDGVVDSREPSPVNHIYSAVGTFYPTLTVTSEDGSIGRDIFNVVVEPNISLAIDNPAPDPEQGESATTKVTVNGALSFRVDIESAAGTLVRTLSDYATRSAGEYDFVWNGRDASNWIMPPSDYYAVVRYRVDGEEKVLDLRTSSGGEYFYPSGWGGNTC